MKLLRHLLAALLLVTAPILLNPSTSRAVIYSSQVTITATGNSITTNFTYPFIIPYQSNGTTPAVTVTLTQAGNTVTLSPSVYTITGVGNPSGGYVHYPLSGSPIDATQTITITRSLAYIQPTAVSNNNFYPHTTEQIADNLDMQIQQLAADVAAGGGGGGTGVQSLNGLTGNPSIVAGSGISVTAAGSTITITNTGGGGGGGVTSYNGRTGAVTAQSSDVTGALGYTPANRAGDTFTGKVIVPASTTGGAGFNLPQGAVPTSPVNGDLWGTSTGVFARVNGSTQQLATTGGAVTSFNTRTGAVTLTNADVNTAMGYTPIGAANLLAGTNVTLNTVGNDVTISAASSGGTQNVTYFTSIAALRAGSSITVPNAIVQAYYTTQTGGGGNFYYVSTDMTTSDNNCTVFVDAGSHRWYRQYAGPLDVRWCGAKGDGSTDDQAAIQAAVNLSPVTYIPGNSTCYVVGSAITLTTNKTIEGDGPNASCVKASGAAYPVITMTNPGTSYPDVYSIRKMTVRGLYLDRTATATSGGDGIAFPYYTNDSAISNMYITHQWNGIRVTSTDYSSIDNSQMYDNYDDGVEITNSTYAGIQWYLTNLLSARSNGYGYNVHASIGVALYPATTLVTALAGGTDIELRTFANTLGGFSARGLSMGGGAGGTSPISVESIRLQGGFFGEDNTSEIFLDTYGSGHVVQPTFVELAGQSPSGVNAGTAATHTGQGIELTSNNVDVVASCGRCVNNSYNGLVSSATSVTVTGGNFMNNGLATVAGQRSGIYILGGSGVISGVRSSNVNGASGTQLFGIAAAVDAVAVAGCDLRGFASGGNYTTFSGGTTNSIISGCMPLAANLNSGGTGGPFLPLSGGTITGNLAVTGDTTTGTLHSGTSSLSGGVNVTAGGMNFSSVGGNGLTVDNITANTSVGVGTAATGGAGHLDVAGGILLSGATGGYVANSINIPGTFRINNSSIGGNSITGNLTVSGTITAGGDIAAPTAHITTAAITNLNVSGSAAVSGGVQALDIYATRSAGVGTPPTGNPGRLDIADLRASATGVFTGTLGAAGTTVSSLTSSGAISGTTITSSSDLIANGLFHGNGTSVFNASLNVVGSFAATAGIQGANIYATVGLGVGTGPFGVAGRVDITSGIYLNGVAYTNP